MHRLLLHAVLGFRAGVYFYRLQAGEYSETKRMVEKMMAKGGTGGSSADGPSLLYRLNSRIPSVCVLSSSTPYILCTTISGEGRQIYFLVNTSSHEYRGTCTLRSVGKPTVRDPETGNEHSITCQKIDSTSSQIELTLPPFASLFIEF